METIGTCLLLRRATEDDLSRVHDSYFRSVDAGEDLKPRVRRSQIKNDFVWIVEADGLIRGHSLLRRFVKDDEVIGYIVGIFLEKNWRRQGLGSELLLLMELEARGFGARSLVVDSTPTAQPFFKEHGFSPQGAFRPVVRAGVSTEILTMRKIF